MSEVIKHMKTAINTDNRQRHTVKRLTCWAALVAAILMIPLVTKAPWTGGDYVFAGVVLFGAASVYELSTRAMRDPKRRFAVGAVVLIFVLGIWAAAVAS